ncbi:murein biosynthesis integral membrane protein MurJ [Laspinema sp. A4]|uniref:murein biosynthesis integral membrane protein MurJ n=1 Tax=Laspinema sp. D2d TaxID=2953686 RepID=UPI0021BAE96A|nr:murein biosynthesis integral membrane protein MurJ [Laspinema sp. D2d]MCT7983394.1 murein biosynthesis integral membrane protein MurJ [Laspinema sp. D2d]
MSDLKKPARSLAGIAGLVAIATLISKVFGLVRQQAIAAAFGVGPAFDAYNYAYVIPGFLLILLGGINGPFHSAIVSVLAKRKPEEAAPLVETITTLVGGLLLIVTGVLVLFAEPLMGLVAPGLNISAAEAAAQGLSSPEFETLQLTHAIAIQQFRIMAPLAVLAGLIGIGFGALNAADQYWIPSISPLFSSVALIGALGVFILQAGKDIGLPEYAMTGGMVLAWGTLAGAVLQWLVQVVTQWRSGLGTLRLRFEFNRPGVKEVMKVMGPATFSSGMLQINVYTDLFFASYIPQAAAALGYAGLLVQTPLGIVSNMLLVPLLPVFSRLADPNDWPQLKQRIRQGLMLTGLTMLPLGAFTIALSVAIVRVIYERGAFDQAASAFVAPMLMAYGIGMFVYLGRDVLVRVFYALGDGDTPFRVSLVNIVLNAVLDFFMVRAFGAPGLVLATVGVNIISMLALLILLDRKLNGLPLAEWSKPIALLTGASAVAGVVSWVILQGCDRFFEGTGLLIYLVELGLSSLGGFLVFAAIVTQIELPEVDIFVQRIRQRFGR